MKNTCHRLIFSEEMLQIQRINWKGGHYLLRFWNLSPRRLKFLCPIIGISVYCLCGNISHHPDSRLVMQAAGSPVTNVTWSRGTVWQWHGHGPTLSILFNTCPLSVFCLQAPFRVFPFKSLPLQVLQPFALNVSPWQVCQTYRAAGPGRGGRWNLQFAICILQHIYRSRSH